MGVAVAAAAAGSSGGVVVVVAVTAVARLVCAGVFFQSAGPEPISSLPEAVAVRGSCISSKSKFAKFLSPLFLHWHPASGRDVYTHQRCCGAAFGVEDQRFPRSGGIAVCMYVCMYIHIYTCKIYVEISFVLACFFIADK